ncbi:MAG: FKBP-type peptidyl-prolyl cis-trans isomerase, partial [Candidatus Methanoplasma sp.]|nr:FKBP-type peptidyl-prolyl cis-trans isomerase [Candidatus Methanoplasma sp.]
MAEDEVKVKKDRDPIMMVCLVVFLLTACVITSASVYNNYLKADDTLAVNGSTVSVNYIGTYYAHYGDENYAVFDTSRWSVANDDKVLKSNDFTKNAESAHKPLEFAVGGGSVLEGFSNAVIGHKVGDKIKVVIPAGEGYNAAEADVTVSTSSVISMPATEVLTAAQFREIYGYDLK